MLPVPSRLRCAPSRCPMNFRILSAAMAATLAFTAVSVSALGIDGREVKPAGRPATDAVMAATDKRLLVLASGIYNPSHQRLVAPVLLHSRSAAEPNDRYIVQFNEGALAGAPAELKAAGVQISGYLPHNAYLVRWNGDLAGLQQLDGVRFVGPWEPVHKLAPDVTAAALSPNPGESVWVNVIGFEGESIAALEQSVREVVGSAVQGVNKTRAGLPRVLLQMTTPELQGVLAAIADKRLVGWIELFEFPRTYNVDSVGPIQGNAASVPSGGVPTFAPIWARGLLGTGQIVAVADSGLDRNEGWFNRYSKNGNLNTEITDAVSTQPPVVGALWPDRKVVGYFNIPSPTPLVAGGTPYDNGGSFHGTHTSGTVAGDAGTAATNVLVNYQTGEGMAPNAQLLFQDIGNDQTSTLTGDSDTDMWLQARAGGAFISSNSYGAPNTGVYNSSDAGVDRAAYLAEDLLIAFAAGNDDPGFGSIGHPAHSKNALTVGALGHGNSTTVASFSNWGPASDGRRKPDIQAPGSGIVSAGGNDTDTNPPPNPDQAITRTISGTSMSTPTVAGGAALMRQYFHDGMYPTGTAVALNQRNPLSAEMKAILLNGTAFLPVSPDNTGGWGRIWLDSNLFFTGDGRDLRLFGLQNQNGLRTGQQHEYQVQVNAGAEFRATLVWNDVPGALGAGIALVNNLDLEVVDGSANLYRGNAIVGVGPLANSVTTGSADTLNTVEQVRFTAPTAGLYTIRVKGTAVPGSAIAGSDRQGYGLAIAATAIASAVTTAPSDFTVSNQAGGLQVTASVAVPNATAYQVYRADGTCATADSRTFQYVGTTAGNSFLDTGTQGGYTYAYRIRGVDVNGEGPASLCKDIVSTQACTLDPTFNEATLTAARISGNSCGTMLGWTAGASNCPAAPVLKYNVYRSTDPFFTPGAANRITTVTGNNSYNDTTAQSLTTYFYAVRAEDGTSGNPGPNGGNESNGTFRQKFTPFGLTPTPGTFTDGADSPSFIELQSPWYVSNTRASAGTLSYHNAQPGQALYSPDVCAAITSPDILVQAGAVMTYKARYNLEVNWDGVVTEISTNGGANWTQLPPNGGFPSNFSQTGNPPINACAYLALQGAFSGTTNTLFNTFTTSLASFAGQTVRVRWRFSSDPGSEEEGFYLDEVSITNASTPGMCVNDFLLRDGFE